MIYMSPIEIVEKFGKFKGVLHVGAHEAQERKDYVEAGIQKRVWIEANPKIVDKLSKSLSGEDDTVLHAAVSENDGEDVELNIASFDQSSSILPLKLHSFFYGGIVYTGRYKTKSTSLKTILDGIQGSEDLDLINLDIQGVELRALRGLKERLDQFRAVYTEINTLELYENCDLMSDMDKFMSSHGFDKIGYKIYENHGWGDALYVRNK